MNGNYDSNGNSTFGSKYGMRSKSMNGFGAYGGRLSSISGSGSGSQMSKGFRMQDANQTQQNRPGQGQGMGMNQRSNPSMSSPGQSQIGQQQRGQQSQFGRTTQNQGQGMMSQGQGQGQGQGMMSQGQGQGQGQSQGMMSQGQGQGQGQGMMSQGQGQGQGMMSQGQDQQFPTNDDMDDIFNETNEEEIYDYVSENNEMNDNGINQEGQDNNNGDQNGGQYYEEDELIGFNDDGRSIDDMSPDVMAYNQGGNKGKQIHVILPTGPTIRNINRNTLIVDSNGRAQKSNNTRKYIDGGSPYEKKRSDRSSLGQGAFEQSMSGDSIYGARDLSYNDMKRRNMIGGDNGQPNLGDQNEMTEEIELIHESERIGAIDTSFTNGKTGSRKSRSSSRS